MKKITFLALHLGYGGIEKCISNVANLLCDDYEIEILCTYKLYDEPKYPFNDKIKIAILSAKIVLKDGDKNQIRELILDRLKRRKESQPLEYPSAGSVFRNPSKEQPAGKLIEEIGFKGKEIGGAEVSLKHANFIVNKDNAKAKDIVELINSIKKAVKDEYNIDLICEQEIINW